MSINNYDPHRSTLEDLDGLAELDGSKNRSDDLYIPGCEVLSLTPDEVSIKDLLPLPMPPGQRQPRSTNW